MCAGDPQRQPVGEPEFAHMHRKLRAFGEFVGPDGAGAHSVGAVDLVVPVRVSQEPVDLLSRGGDADRVGHSIGAEVELLRFSAWPGFSGHGLQCNRAAVDSQR